MKDAFGPVSRYPRPRHQHRVRRSYHRDAARRLRRGRHQDRAPVGDPARSHGANKNGHGLWWKVISRNKRCVTLNLGRPEGQQMLRDLVRTMRMCSSRISVPACWRNGVWAGRPHQKPRPDRVACHRLRSGRAVRGATSIRYAGRSDERIRPSDRPRRRAADAAAVRSRRRGSGITGAFAVVTALYHRAARKGRTRTGHRPVPAGAAPRDPRPGTQRVRSTRRDPGPTRQPFPEQRPAQYVPHQRDRWVAISASATSVAERVCGWSVDPTSSRSPGLPRPVSAAGTETCSMRRSPSGSRPVR